MNRRGVLALIACAGFFLAQATANGQEELSLKALTFNLRYNNPGDGLNSWPHRREMAAELIRRVNADFAGLQEALPDQIADLRAALPDYAWFGRSREVDPNHGEAVPIVYRKNRWRLDPKEQGVFWLSGNPEEPGSNTWGGGCRRIVTWGRFIEIESGRGIYLYNTHFDFNSESARQKSAVLLAKRIAARKQQEPVIVTGDFNAGESSAAIRYLVDPKSETPVKLFDTFRAVHPDANDVGTRHDFKGGTSGEKIDFVFILPEAIVRSAEILREHHGNLYPSDHYPVVAEVSFVSENTKQ